MGIRRAARSRLSAKVLSGVLLLAMMSGCGAEAARDSSDSRRTAAPLPKTSDESSREAPTTESEADPQARKAVRSAFRRLVRANTGRFEVAVPLGEELYIEELGRYQIDPPAYDVVREFTSPEASLRVAIRGVGEESWLRLESLTTDEGEVAPWPCWVSYDDIAGLNEFPVELAQARPGPLPSAILAASYGVGMRAIDGQSVEGTTDLALALSLMSGKVMMAAGIDIEGDDTVPASFSIDRQTLAGFTVPLAGLPDAIARAGGDLGPELGSLAELPGSITARFSEMGVPVEVQAPAFEERLTIDTAEDLESAMNACGDQL